MVLTKCRLFVVGARVVDNYIHFEDVGVTLMLIATMLMMIMLLWITPPMWTPLNPTNVG